MKPENWHRRHAIQVAACLPEGTEDALTVLRLATQLVTSFLAEDEPVRPAPVVVLIGGNECA
ncbi:hypothetical protein JEY40_26555 [Bradyrhizobium japonicum]|uniref:hypothetical protein n=1 Tax=Bradyrhizobium japonicum TaxID=375 RepID=UPI00200D252E|nr:hypothetical protein [Bradyrhizobium japonicum]UQD69565.1 hypothetical protein JEY40_26555 [Bradyrhizobium japonicum]